MNFKPGPSLISCYTLVCRSSGSTRSFPLSVCVVSSTAPVQLHSFSAGSKK